MVENECDECEVLLQTPEQLFRAILKDREFVNSDLVTFHENLLKTMRNICANDQHDDLNGTAVTRERATSIIENYYSIRKTKSSFLSLLFPANIQNSSL